MRQRGGLRLCGRLSRGSAHRHCPVSEADSALKQRPSVCLAFCNNAGPAFILGVVGAGYLGAVPWGCSIPGTHCRLPVRRASVPFLPPHEGPPGSLTAPSIPGRPFSCCLYPLGHRSSVLHPEHLRLCMLFCVVIRMLSLAGFWRPWLSSCRFFLGPLGSPSPGQNGCSPGVLEISSGVSSLTDGSLPGRLSMAAFMLGWAGLSVHCQVLAFLGTAACLCAPTLLVNCSMEPFPPLCWAFSPGWSH